MLAALRATPRLERIEAQLMPFGIEFDPAFLSKELRLHTRQFMLLRLADAKVSEKPLSPAFRMEPWSDRAFDSAAQLIQLSYADHVDGEINDQYRTEAGGMKFLRNIVILPGCGQFLPEASFLVRPATGDRLVGMVLTSTVKEARGAHDASLRPARLPGPSHRTLVDGAFNPGAAAPQIRVAIAHSNGGEHFRGGALRASRFRTIKKFAAGVWQA